MIFDEIASVYYLFSALEKFYNTDYAEFENLGISLEGIERACAFRIGSYFRELLSKRAPKDLNIDMEYNRHRNNSKERERFTHELVDDDLEKYTKLLDKLHKKNFTWEEEEKIQIELVSLLRRKIYPDLILHKRGDDSNNILVVEFKVNANKETDANKLKSLTNPQDEYHYKLGIFINIQKTCSCFLNDKQDVKKMRCVLDQWDFFQEGNEIVNGEKQNLIKEIIRTYEQGLYRNHNIANGNGG